MSIEVYVVIFVLAAVAGVIGYIKWLEAKSTATKKELEVETQRAELAKAETIQVRKTDTAKAEVLHKLRKEHIAEQAKIDAGFPRNQFDTEEF